ncbi:MAG: FadR family transcriptional regulator [Akkermansiaceae bacterium]|nr:FadR family transcriptional regulator [Akkermansiaceae bacterium]NNM29700.1 FadR family transcriptional regulator [Akkermansiaceae bacterium]
MPHRSAEVVTELEQEILDGKLTPGERLPSEEKLCERFDASRTVIREAIQQLRGRGLLRTLKGSGSYIADPNLESVGSALHAYSTLTAEDSFLELIDFRILLETECARLAAHNAGEKDIEAIVARQDAMVAAKGDREEFGREDVAFHLSIANASHNPLYATILGALERRCVDYTQANRAEGDWYDRVLETHREIIGAIRNGDSDAAAQAMRHHLLLSRRHYIDVGETGEPAAAH